MKFLLLTVFIAAATATTLYRSGKNIQFSEDGSSVFISNPTTGKRVTITRPYGTKSMEIYINGPNIPAKRIVINDEGRYYGDMDEDVRMKRSTKKSSSQSDVLCSILSEYQGVVDEASYEKLMSKIDKAVKKGEISSQIYDVLQSLDQYDYSTTGAGASEQKYAPYGFGYGYGNGYYYPSSSPYGTNYGAGALSWFQRMVPRVQASLGYTGERFAGNYYRPYYPSGYYNNYNPMVEEQYPYSYQSYQTTPRGAGYYGGAWKDSSYPSYYPQRTTGEGYYQQPSYYGGYKDDFRGRSMPLMQEMGGNMQGIVY